MEFDFNINQLLGSTISVVDKNVQPHQNLGDGTLKDRLEHVIDAMGKASAKAQGLGGAITTAYKLHYSDHRLYIMKESQANSGRGSIVGILKVGRKVLFVLDHHSNQIEMKPMCVLDFYVHESCQRRGYGKQLFQHMLNCERIEPQHLAIDRPSKKFTSFLMKHYRLRATIPQVNNFVVFEGFFKNQPDSSYPRRRSAAKPPIPPSTTVTPGKYRNASHSSLWMHRTHSRSSSGDMSDEGNPLNLDRVTLNNIRPRSGSLPSLRGSPQGSQEDTELATRGLNYSRHHRSATPPSRPGSGKTVASPITGNITPAFNSSPVVTTARNTSMETTPVYGSKQNHIVDKLYSQNGTVGHIPHATSIVTNGQASHTSPFSSGSVTTNLPSSTTNISNNPTKDSPGNRFITKEGNYCLTSPTVREMPSSWNVMGVPPGSQRYQQGQSPSALYRNSHYQVNRFF